MGVRVRLAAGDPLREGGDCVKKESQLISPETSCDPFDFVPPCGMAWNSFNDTQSSDCR